MSTRDAAVKPHRDTKPSCGQSGHGDNGLLPTGTAALAKLGLAPRMEAAYEAELADLPPLPSPGAVLRPA